MKDQKILRIRFPHRPEYRDAVSSYGRMRPHNIKGPYTVVTRHYSDIGGISAVLAMGGNKHLLDSALIDYTQGDLTVEPIGRRRINSERFDRKKLDLDHGLIEIPKHSVISLDAKRHALSYSLTDEMYERRGAGVERQQLHANVMEWLEGLPSNQITSMFDRYYTRDGRPRSREAA